MTLRPRRLAALAVAAALALGTAACGSSDSDSDSGTGTSAASGGGDPVTMWTFKQSHVAGLEAAAAAFERETGTPVEIEVTTPQEAYVTKLQAAARTRSLPDLLSVGSADESFRYAASGILADVTDDFDQTMQDEMLPGIATASQLTELAIENSKGDPQNSLARLTAGHWYGIPYVAGASGIVLARKSALEEAGVDAARASASWEGFVEAVGATHARSERSGGIVTGMQIPETAYQWLYRPLAFNYLGKEAFDGRQSRAQTPAWNSPESVETFTLYDQMSPFWAPGVLSLGIDQADQAFAQGKAAWDIGGTYTLPFLLQQGMRAEELEMFPVPASSRGEHTRAELAATPILSTGVTTQAKNPEGAIAFAQYLGTGEGARVFAETASEVPASAAAADALASNPLLGPVLDALRAGSDQAFNGDLFAADPVGNPPVKHDVAVELAKLVAGTSTPQKVADALVGVYQRAWEKAGG
ncbi:MAG TPA: extracellular solute-binding protein [Conexibacter sp.]|nr:extracellular solute-binding protein [Conexibacter sp.]